MKHQFNLNLPDSFSQKGKNTNLIVFLLRLQNFLERDYREISTKNKYKVWEEITCQLRVQLHVTLIRQWSSSLLRHVYTDVLKHVFQVNEDGLQLLPISVDYAWSKRTQHNTMTNKCMSSGWWKWTAKAINKSKICLINFQWQNQHKSLGFSYRSEMILKYIADCAHSMKQ